MTCRLVFYLHIYSLLQYSPRCRFFHVISDPNLSGRFVVDNVHLLEIAAGSLWVTILVNVDSVLFLRRRSCRFSRVSHFSASTCGACCSWSTTLTRGATSGEERTKTSSWLLWSNTFRRAASREASSSVSVWSLGLLSRLPWTTLVLHHNEDISLITQVTSITGMRLKTWRGCTPWSRRKSTSRVTPSTFGTTALSNGWRKWRRLVSLSTALQKQQISLII